jgi:hypothetical protein
MHLVVPVERNLYNQRSSKRDYSVCVQQGVVMDSLKFHPGPPYPTPLRPAGGPSLKQPYGHFRGGLPAGQATCGRLLPDVTEIVHKSELSPKLLVQIFLFKSFFLLR